MYIDSHCHLNDEAFKDDLNSVLEAMADKNILNAMLISLSLEGYKQIKKISHKDIKFKKSVGIFPCDAKDFDLNQFDKYVTLFKEADAIGEIGLDYYWQKDQKDIQQKIFKMQLDQAQILNKPVIIHSRDALQDTLDILKTYKLKGVMHCYSGSYEMAKEFIKCGFYISISGVVTFKNANTIKEVVEKIDLKHLLIETDSPYLTPNPNRGKRNDPTNVIYVAQEIAKIKNIDVNDVCEQVFKNYIDLFGN